MIYIGIKLKDIVISKAIKYEEFIGANELEITKAQYDNLPIPCKLVDGAFIPCDYPVMEMEPHPPREPTETELLVQAYIDLDYRLSLQELGGV